MQSVRKYAILAPVKQSEKRTEQPWYEKAAGKKPRSEKNAAKAAKKQEKKNDATEKREKSLARKPQAFSRSQAADGRQNLRTKKADFRAPIKSKSLSAKPLFDLSAIPSDARAIIEQFDVLIQSVRPLSAKQQVVLPQDIKTLSHQLTDERESRRTGYMNSASSVSAYIHYFMWWNLVRLTRLLAPLPAAAFPLTDGDAVLDIGSGPLTVPIALWLSWPELRTKKLTVYCMDTSQNALSAGEELFLAVAAKTQCVPWKIVRVRGDLGEHIQIKEKAALITCANVFNEVVQKSDMPPDFLAKKYSRILLDFARARTDGTADGIGGTSSILLIEPGDPKSARFISLMRDAFIRKDYAPLSPCPHSASCPMAGRHVDKNGNFSGKWCNFAFATADAPEKLLTLSEKAFLSKDRATLSFVLLSNGGVAKEIEKNREQQKNAAWKAPLMQARITSDAIRLPEQHATGYYACSEKGLLLVLDKKHAEPKSGDLIEVRAPSENAPTDKKSGACVVTL